MISVIIPAYNEEGYLERTLESIKKQEINKEIIVVCNGCTDGSFEIAKKYSDKVFQIKDKNVSKARNLGVKMSSKPYLVFLDADVVLGERVLESVFHALERGTFFGTVKGNGKGIKNKVYLTFKNLVNSFRPWSHGFVYCDKKNFLESGGFNENLKVGELQDFFSKVKGRYLRLNRFVEPSDRRIKNWGIVRASKYWLFDKKKVEYEAIR